MQFITSFITLLAITSPSVYGTPLKSRQTTQGPIPSESSYYSDYRGLSPPFPANETAPILPTCEGPPAPDDQLFQNLLAAEWAIFNFYQQAVELLNATSFTDLGLPNSTYDRISEIRDNEAGHMRIFQESIGNTSVKPGSCEYDFGWTSGGGGAQEFLALQVLIEVSSMAFATGLVQQAKMDASKGEIVAVGETETR